MNLFRRSSLPIAAWVGLACLVLLGVAPASARASCGDYVHIVPGNAAATSARADDARPEAPKQPCPCRGPECSRAPVAPLVPPAPVSPSQVQPEGIVDGDAYAGSERGAALSAESHSRPSRLPSVIFHPPRHRGCPA